MKQRDIRQAKSPELRGSLEAMRRAGELARQRAIQTNTNLVRLENGRVIRAPPEQLRRETEDSTQS